MTRGRLGVVWIGAFAFFVSFFLVLTPLPLYARRLGLSDAAIGMMMGSFAVTAMLLRPVAGWGADRYGRRPFMLAGATIFLVSSIAYGLITGSLGLFLVRLVHGAGMGLYPTAASALVADVAPPERRGEFFGLFGASGSLAMAVGPVTGIALANALGFAPLFFAASVLATLAFARRSVLPRSFRRWS